MLPGIAPLVSSPSRPSLSFISSAVSPSDLVTYTFNAVPLGPDDPRRTIIVVAGGRRSTQADCQLASVTVAGQNAPIVFTANNPTGAGGGPTMSTVVGMATARPSGASGQVVITFNNQINRAGIAIYSAIGLRSDLPTAIATPASSLDTATVMSTTIDIEGYGIAIGAIFHTGNQNVSWSGLSEDVDQQVEGTIYQSMASHQSVVPEVARSVVVSPAVNFACLGVAAFR